MFTSTLGIMAINGCHVDVTVCNVSLWHFSYISCFGLAFYQQKIYQSTNQSAPLSLWEVRFTQDALSHTVNTVTFKKRKDLQNIISHTRH